MTHDATLEHSAATVDAFASPTEILIVDDDEDCASITSDLLASEGFRVCVSHSSEAALQCLSERKIVCAIVDFEMPKEDGLDFVKRVRGLHSDDVVLIALTGHLSTDGRVGDFLATVDHYFQKPLDWEDLFRVIRGLR